MEDYQTEIKDVNEVTKQIAVTIPADVVNQEIDGELGRIAKTATLKGFRKGKAPRNMVEKLHGSRVRMEIAHRLISTSLSSLIEKHKIEAIGDPEIDISSFEPGEQLDYKASVFLFPTPKVTDYAGVSVEAPKLEVADADIDKAVEELRRSKAKTNKIESRDVVQAGDVIDANLSVEIEGEPAGPAEPLVVAVGEGNLPDEIEKGLLGLKIGEERTIESKIADDHRDEKIRGKSAKYQVTLNGISEQILPEVDDQFAKDAGLEVETVLELRLKIRKELEKNSDNEQKAEAQARVLDAVLEKNAFLVPQVLVDDEIRNLLVKHGMVDPNKTDVKSISVVQFREALGPTAEKRVRTSVLVDRIAEQEKLSATDAEIETAYQEIAEKNGLPLEQVKQFFGDEYRGMTFRLEQTRNKVLEFLVAKAEVKYVDSEKLKTKEAEAA